MRVMSLGVKINFNLPGENAKTGGAVVAPSDRFCGMIRVDGQETAQFRSDVSVLQCGAEDRHGDRLRHRSYGGGQAEDLRRHGSCGQGYARAGQSSGVDFSTVGRGAEARLRPAREEVS